MTVNENIRRIRLEKGMTQKQVAQACGTADAYIRAYELGKYNPKPATVAKIARALGVTPAELYGMGEAGPSDPDTELGFYQTENGGLVDEATINKRRMLAVFGKLNPRGQEVAIKWAEELTTIPAYRVCQSVVDVLATLTEDQQGEIQAAYQSLQNLELEKSMMEQSGTGTPDAWRSNTELIKERRDTILTVILAALERSETSNSSK